MKKLFLTLTAICVLGLSACSIVSSPVDTGGLVKTVDYKQDKDQPIISTDVVGTGSNSFTQTEIKPGITEMRDVFVIAYPEEGKQLTTNDSVNCLNVGILIKCQLLSIPIDKRFVVNFRNLKNMRVIYTRSNSSTYYEYNYPTAMLQKQ